MPNQRRRQIPGAETGGAFKDRFLELKWTAVRFRHIYRSMKARLVNCWDHETDCGFAVNALQSRSAQLILLQPS